MIIFKVNVESVCTFKRKLYELPLTMTLQVSARTCLISAGKNRMG
jgi:hypothetical protein